jgi:very-short-patch-repair endonuclease
MKRPSESQDGCASIKQMQRPSSGIASATGRSTGTNSQVPISGYICDFVCREQRLVIEVDGGQHNESDADAIRDRRLMDEGYRVLRFWNNDVLGNMEGVLMTIQAELLK